MPDFQYPVLVRSIDDQPGDTVKRVVVVELADGDQFNFNTMTAAEDFMAVHALKPVTADEMGMLRAVIDDDGEEHPAD